VTSRNLHVEEAVDLAIRAIGEALSEQDPRLPAPALRRAIDGQIEKSASVRVASLFLLAYSLSDPSWDGEHIPTGVRGKFGDKRLAAFLSESDLTLHSNITAFGENLGWKGNVQQFRLSTDSRFTEYAMVLKGSPPDELHDGLAYFAGRFAASRQVLQPLPPLPPDLLTFAKARVLFQDLVGTPSEGHIQQFLIAGLLRSHRRRIGNEIKTHHPHAADTFDRTAGDIEEFQRGELVAAYEVTVRDDWKNRIPDFRKKMEDYGLSKYWLIAGRVYSDADLADPTMMLTFLKNSNADLAVVDIKAFVDVFVAELTATELRTVVNEVYADLINPVLSRRQQFIDLYTTKVGRWLDSQG